MKFKKLKYNLICLLLVLIISAAVVVKVMFVDAQTPQTDLTIGQQQGGTGANGQDAEKDGTSASQEEQIVYEKDKNLPSIKFPYKLINYCFQKMNDAESYKSDVEYICKFSVVLAGQPIYAIEDVRGETMKSGLERYESVEKHADDNARTYAGSSAEDGLQIRYTDGINDAHMWYSKDGIFDVAKLPYKKYDKISDVGFYFDMMYPMPSFNKKGATVSASTDSNNTIRVSVKMTDKNAYPESFLRSYNSFAKNINISSITQEIVFTIDKNSGYILSLYKTDKFIGSPMSFSGIELNMDLTYKEVFSKFNQPIIITPPNIPSK